jgi:hypothetical protein
MDKQLGPASHSHDFPSDEPRLFPKLLVRRKSYRYERIVFLLFDPAQLYHHQQRPSAATASRTHGLESDFGAVNIKIIRALLALMILWAILNIIGCHFHYRQQLDVGHPQTNSP